MRFDGNGGSAPNYRPNSFDDLVEDVNYKGLPYELDSNIAGYFDKNENDDNHYTQPVSLFKIMASEAKTIPISNIVVRWEEYRALKKIKL